MVKATQFKDCFSGHAPDYARSRPTYPTALFEYFASITADRECAWDCATGNGQAAVGLAAHFETVIATDGSRQQIEVAQRRRRVRYSVSLAENSRIDAKAVSFISVAQALHWFDIPMFFAEAQRVLRPGGIIAIWGYNLPTIADGIDSLVSHYYRTTTGPFWPPEIEIIEKGYRSIAFPFREIAPVPAYIMKADWTLEQLLNYLRTWSATQQFIKARGSDPLLSLAVEIQKVWGAPDIPRLVQWPLAVRIGQWAG